MVVYMFFPFMVNVSEEPLLSPHEHPNDIINDVKMREAFADEIYSRFPYVVFVEPFLPTAAPLAGAWFQTLEGQHKAQLRMLRRVRRLKVRKS